MLRTLLAILALAYAVLPQTAQDGKVDARVSTARKRLDDAELSAASAYDAAVRKATDDYNKAIDALITDAQRKGDAADVGRLQEQKRPPPAPLSAKATEAGVWPLITDRQKLTARLLGTTWKSAGDVEEFRPDGTLHTDDPTKTGWVWVALDATHVLVQYPGGWINVFEFSSDLASFRLFETCRPKPTESTWRFQK